MSVSARAASFGLVAEDYHRWRPSYPPAAVDWLAPSPPAHVADLGAGTGKLTELLAARGLRVDAVEHDPRMLEVLGRHVPGARLHVSDASSIPLEDGSLDAVLVADAWHWFDPEPTVAEVRRVLRPGGWLGLVWNVVATPVEPWELALADDSQEYDRARKAGTEGLSRRLSYLPSDELAFTQVEWEWEVTPDQWASFSATTSMAIAMSPRERADALSRTRAQLQQVCDDLGRDAVPIRHVASCVRWTPAR
ncbi:class I SAM-dependent methyltransferase [Nocardioides sediminis]|uniref:class I SAM-dependent methyltransferase n=1 Tax=Nocardioides sediminis TaxID=433648 RepID=UPI000D2FDD06|nr:class I SAM-dependent methyltransferase [Nocardioides sediminis]